MRAIHQVRRRRRTSLAAAGLVLAASTAACGVFGPAGSVETREPVRTQVVTIPVPTRDKTEAGAAADILSARLRSIGIGNFTLDIGDRMTFQLTVPMHVDSLPIDAVLHDAGEVTFVPWKGDTVPASGTPVPAGLMPLFDAATGVAGASVGSDQSGVPTADIKLGDAAARTFATWTTAHVGEYLLVVMDGTVATSPIIMEPITGGEVQLSFAPPSSMTPQALVAILSSGPLPASWRQSPAPSS